MPLSPDDRELLLTTLFARLRTIEAARGLSLSTRESMQYRLVDELPDKTFGGNVTASSVQRVYIALPDGDEATDDVRQLTLDEAKTLPADASADPPETDAAMLLATLVLNDSPVYIESANLEQLDTAVLDAAFSGAEGESYLWLDTVTVQRTAMTRCMAALAAPEAVARSRATPHDAFYARRSNARAAEVVARIDASAQPAAWKSLARNAFARVPALRAATRDGVELLAPEGRRLLDLKRGLKTPRLRRKVTAGLPALKFQRLGGALSLPQPTRSGRPLDRIDVVRDDRVASPLPGDSARVTRPVGGASGVGRAPLGGPSATIRVRPR